MPDVRLWDNPGQAVVGVVVVAAAVLVLVTRRRLTAVMLVGATGYGVSLLFILHGAPDLAITQMLVETVSLVVFVLALRRLPTKFTRHPALAVPHVADRARASPSAPPSAPSRSSRRAAARADPVSVGFPTEAYAFGHGKNIVNVTLVDIRAWDTLGEVSVLVAAATGIASLIFVRTRNTRLSRATAKALPSSNPARGTWLHGGRTMRKEKRSVIFEVVTRLVFHVMLAASLFLLFAGHNQPGGGFAGGLVAGLALVVRYLAGGRYELDEAAPFDAGLARRASACSSPSARRWRRSPSAARSSRRRAVDFTLPPWGEVHLVTSLFFDVGVYLIVVGMMLDIVRSLGTGIDRQIAEEESDQESDRGVRPDRRPGGPTPEEEVARP